MFFDESKDDGIHQLTDIQLNIGLELYSLDLPFHFLQKPDTLTMFRYILEVIKIVDEALPLCSIH